MNREQRLARVFVELADTMVADFDAIDLLHTLTERTVSLLDVDAAGLVMADPRGRLQVLAATSHTARLLELFELQNEEGPCLDCYTSGEQVVNVDLNDATARWPKFSTASVDAGYQSVHALPLRLRKRTLGAMNLFCSNRSTLTSDDLAVGQAMADVSTIGLLQERNVRRQEVLAEQLHTALNSRILIEQAKGVLAERAGIDVGDAFRRMRAYSRRASRPLNSIATAVIENAIAIEELQKVSEKSPG